MVFEMNLFIAWLIYMNILERKKHELMNLKLYCFVTVFRFLVVFFLLAIASLLTTSCSVRSLNVGDGAKLLSACSGGG